MRIKPSICIKLISYAWLFIFKIDYEHRNIPVYIIYNKIKGGEGMDIRTGAGGVAGRLSNLTHRRFLFDGIECGSIEGALQSFKFKDPNMQAEICKLGGMKAKRSGSSKNWRQKQVLYWKGNEIKRDSQEYQKLLDLLYQSAFDQCEKYRKDILSCVGVTFTHSIGKRKVQDTVLTTQEFTSRLKKLRDGQRLV